MKKIMVVDDEILINTALQKTLKSIGYEIAGAANSGEKAVAVARDSKPDLILMDIRMPGKMDGIDASVRIRRDMDIPVIFLTAFGDDRSIERSKNAEPYGYIIKPFQKTQLKAAIETALHKREMEKHLRIDVCEDKARKAETTSMVKKHEKNILDFKDRIKEISDEWLSIKQKMEKTVEVLENETIFVPESEFSEKEENLPANDDSIVIHDNGFLTTREKEILQHIGEGLSYKEIAERLFLSLNTVHVHRRNIMKKLKINKQTNLLRFALKNGLSRL
jgi:DNA-binding NarL/FixJ family response regulator